MLRIEFRQEEMMGEGSFEMRRKCPECGALHLVKTQNNSGDSVTNAGSGSSHEAECQKCHEVVDFGNPEGLPGYGPIVQVTLL